VRLTSRPASFPEDHRDRPARRGHRDRPEQRGYSRSPGAACRIAAAPRASSKTAPRVSGQRAAAASSRVRPPTRSYRPVDRPMLEPDGSQPAGSRAAETPAAGPCRRGSSARPSRARRNCEQTLCGLRAAIRMPASQPGARPPRGNRIESRSTPVQASSQEVTELEFHISPSRSSSRPHVGVGTCGTNSTRRRARTASSLSRCGLSTASLASGITPSRQQRIS
jgi:hypothetical protein